jgi:hypothetical protein
LQLDHGLAFIDQEALLMILSSTTPGLSARSRDPIHRE